MSKALMSDHILQLEKELMTYTYDALNEHLAEDFIEFGSSGTIYTKQDQLVAWRKNDSTTSHSVSNFAINPLSAEIILATYETIRNDRRISLRSSIWKLNGTRWQMIFHQGTIKAV
ncbi:DUF4440 domain-containing protein [Shouchella patagoniensis]|uniref:nuclear transport factor 2 family protein n=1 Tax=Shouchella patagoniensis TaxID=228576 RepID=UPI0009957E66|nr:DUF4440 domain-containing protein [Shouchella patagoniensis]